MAVDFSAFDEQVDLNALQKEVQEADDSQFEDVPDGDYDVSFDKMEIKPTKKGDKLMFSAQCSICLLYTSCGLAVGGGAVADVHVDALAGGEVIELLHELFAVGVDDLRGQTLLLILRHGAQNALDDACRGLGRVARELEHGVDIAALAQRLEYERELGIELIGVVQTLDPESNFDHDKNSFDIYVNGQHYSRNFLQFPPLRSKKADNISTITNRR